MYGTDPADPGLVRRVVRLADSIKPPKRLAWRARSSPTTTPERRLVRGRGIRRRPRSPLTSLFAALFGWLLG